MAGSPSSLTDLSQLIESLSVNDEGSTAQQALSSILGVDVPLDAGVDFAAGAFAEKLGLRSKKSLAQTAVFVVTKAAILEGAQLIGIGSGVVKLDLGGFQMAQLTREVEEISKKLNIVLGTPLKEAENYLATAMIHLKNESISAGVDELKMVKERAVTAFENMKGAGAKTENLEFAVRATQLRVFADIMIQSFDGKTIVPFFHLEKAKKKTIGELIEKEVREVQTFYESHTISWYKLNKTTLAKEKQDMLDSLLRASYPYISEGRGFTNALGPVNLSLKVLSHLLPEGEEDSAYITMGQHHGEPLTMEVWREKEREKERVMGRFKNAKSCRLGETGATKEKEEELMLTGCLSISFFRSVLWSLKAPWGQKITF